jgi:hypothetical protein
VALYGVVWCDSIDNLVFKKSPVYGLYVLFGNSFSCILFVLFLKNKRIWYQILNLS